MNKRLLWIKKFVGPFRQDDFSDAYPFSDRGFDVSYRAATLDSDIHEIIKKSFSIGNEYDVVVLAAESFTPNEGIELSGEMIFQAKLLLNEINKNRNTPILLVGVHYGLAEKHFQSQNEAFDGLFLYNGLSYEQHEAVIKKILLYCGINVMQITENNLPFHLDKKPLGKEFRLHNKKALYVEYPPQSNFWGCRAFQEIGFEITCVFIKDLSEVLNVDRNFSISFSEFDIVVWAIAGLDKFGDLVFPEDLVNLLKSKIYITSQSRKDPIILIGQHKSLNPIHFESQFRIFDGYFFVNFYMNCPSKIAIEVMHKIVPPVHYSDQRYDQLFPPQL